MKNIDDDSAIDDNDCSDTHSLVGGLISCHGLVVAKDDTLYVVVDDD